VEEAILQDVEDELTNNNVDQMAKDIFSFYVCARWVPDEVFWSVAREELTTEIIKTVVEGQEQSNQAIAELYQNFKFVPLLCSRRLAVFDEKSSQTSTYFASFQEKVLELSRFLESSADSPVWQGLVHSDESFCSSDKMNSATCDAEFAAREWLNQATAWFGSWVQTEFETKQDRWAVMQEIFASFKLREPSESAWNTDLSRWKSLFPYHSFIAKPGGVSDSVAPRSTERFMVCFGQRVASEMHKRPVGTNILTDQNSVGCHGWWDGEQVSQMLARMVALWKPPTCQLTGKAFLMKEQVLRAFARMNEDLFDALPSMLEDEQLLEQGALDEAQVGPPPYDVEGLEVDGETFYSGMRVAKLSDARYRTTNCHRWMPKSMCTITVRHGAAGTLSVTGGNLTVRWDSDPKGLERAVEPAQFQVVPQEYGRRGPGILDTVASTFQAAGQGVADLLQSFWGDQRTRLAEMMSGSLTKWVVCGVAANVSYEELDTRLGTKEEALQERMREAYAKWTGYEGKVPGAECTEDKLLDQDAFPGCRVCDVSELRVDHPEQFWREDGQKEEFMCPLVPPLPPAEQLGVFKKKRQQCLLHMTSSQQRQFQWHYHGHHAARKQNNKQANIARVEYELVKLLDIAAQAGPQQVSFGRSCTLEELKAHPRFCRSPELQQPWPTAEEMAGSISSWLRGALGMPSSAVAELVGHYQRIVAEKWTRDEQAKEAATVLSEQAWDGLLGLGRLAHSAAVSLGSEVAYELPGEAERHARLERELFGFGHGGELLHGASYQSPMDASDAAGNSSERYRRFAVVCDCEFFDPGLELALRWEWSELALRALREAARHAPGIVEHPSPVIELRAEARLFAESVERANETHYAYGASIRPVGVALGPVPCDTLLSWKGLHCVPKDRCEFPHWHSTTCVPKSGAEPQPSQLQDEWRAVYDGKLAKEVGGQPIGQAALSTLKAITVTLHCGPKSAFGPEGGPKADWSLRYCAQEGVKTNAALKAKEPWRLYFPEEVVIVAEFGTLGQALCTAADAAAAPLICAGAQEQEGLDAHLGPAQRRDVGPAEYRGLRTGAGFPAGAVREVLLKPEDVLQVNGQLVP